MGWDVQFLRGSLYLPQIGWWLDAHHPAPRSFVSHAHFDHLATHTEVLCSEGTSRLMRARLPAGNRLEHILPFGQTEPLVGDTTVTLHPAGHIFGSAQSLLAHPDHGTLLYTGDFKLRRGLSAEPCATPRADVLIMETTYGRSHYVLPPTTEVMAAIVRFCRQALEDGDTPVLFGYSLGKSQEVLISLADAQLPVMLHPQVLKLTRVYEEFGLTFPPFRAFDNSALAGHVVICPPQSPQGAFLRKIPRRRTAVLTGWALDPGARFRYQCDEAFPLSDHADFADLLRFVELVQPQRVLTLHGFSADFARTLRERGIEAWAINDDNQLELGLAAPPRVTATPLSSHDPATTPPFPSSAALNLLPSTEARPGRLLDTFDSAGAPTPAAAPDAFARFAAIADLVRDHPGRLQKLAELSTYLAGLDAEPAVTAAVFLTGRAFPQTDPRTLQLGWAVIKRALLAVSGVEESAYRELSRRFAEAGDTAEALLTNHPARAAPTARDEPARAASAESGASRPNEVHAASAAHHPGPPARLESALPTSPSPPALRDIAACFAAIAAARGPAAKLDRLETLLRALSPREAKYLVKIVLGDLRIGLKDGLIEEAIAGATQRSLDAVRRAHLLCGDLGMVLRAARTDTLEAITLRVFHPLQFMLASPEPTADAILARLAPPVWLEEKYDGIRCQLHKQGERVELYSRDLHRITEQFPDLAAAARALPHDLILDGELLAWRDGRALPFAELQKRLGRRGDDFFLGAEIPVSFSGFDVLWLDGRTLLDAPLHERRVALRTALAPDDRAIAPAFMLAPVTHAGTATEIDAAFLAARARGHEGLLAKDPASAYAPGRRGHAWLKLKKVHATLDCVVVAAEYGHGKRRGVLSDYTFAIRDEDSGALLTVGKAYSGLTDAEIATLTEHFLAHTLEVRGRTRRVLPDTVLEIAFDLIQPSDRHESGFALRFPRIVRIRTDKTPAQIDTLATCRVLAGVAASAADTMAAPS